MFISNEEFTPKKMRQSFAVAFYLLFFLISGPISLSVLIYVLFWTQFWWLTLVYGLFWLWDVQTCNRGGRRGWLVPWVRGWNLWKWYRDYFPMKLIKTANLDPTKNYLICSHPHGVLCFGAACCFASEGCDFNVIFPGITPHLTSIEGNMWMPGFREFFMCFGAVSSSRRSLNHLLSQPGGEAPVLLTGGVPEIDNFETDKVRLILKKRKGFVKIALRHGASLVPSFCFGESELFSQLNWSGFLKLLQEQFKTFIGIAPVFFKGRGFIQDCFGIMPQRKALTMVVGEPIHVRKIGNPSEEDVNNLHSRYITKLKNLYKKYNILYGNPSVNLVII